MVRQCVCERERERDRETERGDEERRGAETEKNECVVCVRGREETQGARFTA